jgi:hypothetical protein
MDSGVEGWEVIDRKFIFVERGATCSHLCIGHQRSLMVTSFILLWRTGLILLHITLRYNNAKCRFNITLRYNNAKANHVPENADCNIGIRDA